MYEYPPYWMMMGPPYRPGGRDPLAEALRNALDGALADVVRERLSERLKQDKELQTKMDETMSDEVVRVTALRVSKDKMGWELEQLMKHHVTTHLAAIPPEQLKKMAAEAADAVLKEDQTEIVRRLILNTVRYEYNDLIGKQVRRELRNRKAKVDVVSALDDILDHYADMTIEQMHHEQEDREIMLRLMRYSWEQLKSYDELTEREKAIVTPEAYERIRATAEKLTSD